MPLPSILAPRTSARLRDAILSLQPTAYWPLDDGSGVLRDIAGGWNATVTGSPLYRVAARPPIDRGITWSGSGQYATTSTSVPTPVASISVGAWFQTTDATASARVMLGRGASSQYSWDLRLGASHTAGLTVLQSNNSGHAAALVAGATNDGQWHLVVGTFDGTTLRNYRDTATNSSTSLTGTWHTASTAAVQVAALASGVLWPGALAHLFIINDRVLSASSVRWLLSIGMGG